MKKSFFAVLLSLSVVFTASCGGTDGKELAEKYADTEHADRTPIETPWLSAETKYSPDITDESGEIYAMKRSDILVTEDRIYFQKKFYHGSSDSHDKSFVYVSRKTGECATLCPDPLCTHIEGSGCRYLDLSQLLADSEAPDLIYAVKQGFDGASTRTSICLADTRKDTLTELYADGSTFLTLKFISDGRLYFTTVQYERIKTQTEQYRKR